MEKLVSNLRTSTREFGENRERMTAGVALLREC